MHLKPDEINDKFSKMDGSLQALSSKTAYLPDVAYFDDKLKTMEADLISLNSKSIAKLESKLDSLESRFPDLTCIGSKLSALESKISDLDIKAGASGVLRPDHCEACLSDHFGITLGINFVVGRKTRPKKIYNYNKANWKDLNYDLKKIDWHSLIESTDPHIAWPIFKSILKTLCDQHIPKGNTRNKFQPSWYDSECDKMLRKKEKWREI